jgi:arylsulfatase A-like enzyme
MNMKYACSDRGPTDLLLEEDRWSVEVETDWAISFLENQDGKERDPDKPFSLIMSWNPPHDSLSQVPRRYLDMIDTDVDSLCDWLGNAPDASTEMGSRLRERLRIYYAAITGIDDQFGRILDCLEEQGLADDTIVIFTADHGDQIGFKTCNDPKNSPWEESMRVPFLIRWPGRIPPRFDSVLLSTGDLYPTILELLGLEDEIASDLEGTSLAPHFLGGNQQLPTSQLYMHIREPEGDPAWGRRGVRTHDYTLCINKAPDQPASSVLYDNGEDPFQSLNIAANNRELVEQLINDELRPWLTQTNDPFDIPAIDDFIHNEWDGQPPIELKKK